jgi:glycosyltransferase involved in cell wall biosynthesis
MSAGVSVVICCHNSAGRLPETLRHLAAQRVGGEPAWEVVVVDNASTDDTAQTARRNWPADAPAPLRVVAEPQPGLSHARIRGIREARYEIISFIDDDNWASENWIGQVGAIFARHPEIGVCGGRIEAVCEITPPGWFEMVQGHYAVGQQYKQSGEVTTTSGTLLCGAGLTLRTAALRQLFDDGFVFLLTGRKGRRLLTGEDSELCFALRASGWRFWYEDDLVLRHFIPKERLRWDYAVRLMRGIGESSNIFALYLGALNAPPFDRLPGWKKNWFFQFSKALWQLVRIVGRHPETFFRSPEGQRWSLEFEKLKSQVAAMWALRGRYRQMGNGIRSAGWARATR